MYPPGGNNTYGSQPYPVHQAYGQKVGAPSGSITTPDSGSHLSLSSQRLSSMYGSSQQMETGTYRGNIPAGTGASASSVQYGGQYGASYAAPTHQLVAAGVTGMNATLHQGLSGSSYAGSPSRGQYGPNDGAFSGRDMLSESGRIYSDRVGLTRSHQSEPGDQLSFFRHQQLIQAHKQPPAADLRHNLVDSALDGNIRAADYLAARGTAVRHETQDYGTRDLLVSSYGLRTDVDPGAQGPHQLPGLSLRAAVGRSLEDDAYARGSSATRYGVTLPPGRDYSTGKVLGSTTADAGYRGALPSHKEERGAAHYKLEEREEGLRRDRERARERERLLERRERERERELARAREIRRSDLTPLRRSRDRRASPKRRTEREPPKRSPPHLHRHASPVKEKRRGYICKVTPYSVVEVERDLSSISRRYPRLSISPEFSKLVVRWPKGDLDISFSTPLSFDHDFVEVSGSSEPKDASMKPSDKVVESGSLQPAKTVWNAKVILMSGISADALSQLVSERSSGDKVTHINNILKFAILREGRAFSAIGGQWSAEMDGGDPSSNGDLSLVQTAIRCTKEVVQVDLTNCLKWNPFLEIHYDRVGKDGLCSYREITFLFLPDLESCLPSLDVWRSQWISRREAKVEREREELLKKEKKDKIGAKKDDIEGNHIAESVKSSKVADRKTKEKDDKKVKKENEVDSTGPKDMEIDSKSVEVIKKEKEDKVKKEKEVASVDSKSDTDAKTEEKDKKGTSEDLKGSKPEENSNIATKAKKTNTVVKVKKVKVVKKVVPSEGPETSGKAKPTKKVIKVSGKKAAEKERVGNIDKDKTPKEVPSEAKVSAGKKGKKIIKKEPETVTAEKDEMVENAADKQIEKKVVKESKLKGDQPEEAKKGVKVEKEEIKGKKEVKPGVSAEKVQSPKTDAHKERDVKDDKLDSSAKKDRSGKTKLDSADVTKIEEKIVRAKKDKGKSEDPPQYPGFFLQTKRGKDSNARSTTLSLEGLLDYNENDVEESTFELSLFAEALYEMLQFKMGCRILTFIEKLGQSYLIKRAQRKREREENPEKKNEEKEGSSRKRSKFSSAPEIDGDSAKAKVDTDDSKTQDAAGKLEDVESKPELSKQDEEDGDKMEESEEEDPEEEEPVEEEEDGNESGDDDSGGEEQSEDENKGGQLEPGHEKASNQEGTVEEKQADMEEEPKATAMDESSKQPIMDKELLEAFHFFDRERVGYIRAEDLRSIIHSLGKFHSKRVVKEFLRIAVLESNKGRDDRILYMKLLKSGL